MTSDVLFPIRIPIVIYWVDAGARVATSVRDAIDSTFHQVTIGFLVGFNASTLYISASLPQDADEETEITEIPISLVSHIKRAIETEEIDPLLFESNAK